MSNLYTKEGEMIENYLAIELLDKIMKGKGIGILFMDLTTKTDGVAHLGSRIIDSKDQLMKEVFRLQDSGIKYQYMAFEKVNKINLQEETQ